MRVELVMRMDSKNSTEMKCKLCHSDGKMTLDVSFDTSFSAVITCQNSLEVNWQ